MGLLPIGLCVIGLVGLYMLGRSLGQLRPSREDILRLAGTMRIRGILNGLLIGPALAAVSFSLYILIILQGDYLLRFSHAIFVLGLWMVLTLSFFMLVTITRLGYRPALATLAAPVLVVPLVAYLTPISRFEDSFATSPLIEPLLVGLVIVLGCYFFIFIARHELLGHAKPSPRP